MKSAPHGNKLSSLEHFFLITIFSRVNQVTGFPFVFHNDGLSWIMPNIVKSLPGSIFFLAFALSSIFVVWYRLLQLYESSYSNFNLTHFLNDVTVQCPCRSDIKAGYPQVLIAYFSGVLGIEKIAYYWNVVDKYGRMWYASLELDLSTITCLYWNSCSVYFQSVLCCWSRFDGKEWLRVPVKPRGILLTHVRGRKEIRVASSVASSWNEITVLYYLWHLR